MEVSQEEIDSAYTLKFELEEAYYHKIGIHYHECQQCCSDNCRLDNGGYTCDELDKMAEDEYWAEAYQDNLLDIRDNPD